MDDVPPAELEEAFYAVSRQEGVLVENTTLESIQNPGRFNLGCQRGHRSFSGAGPSWAEHHFPQVDFCFRDPRKVEFFSIPYSAKGGPGERSEFA